MTNCAVVNSDGLIINLIVAEPTDIPPEGCTLVATPDESGNFAQIGGTWDGTQFLPVVTDEAVTDSDPITSGN